MAGSRHDRAGFQLLLILQRMSSVTQPFAREISCAGKMSELPALIEFVEAACEEANIQPDLRFDLTLAVEEAASNVIEHGYKGKGGELRCASSCATGRW